VSKGAKACANCERCSRSATTAGVTAIGRGSLHLATGGVSLVASGMRKKCGVCGHRLAEHRAGLVANVGVTMPQGPTPQELAWQAEQQRQLALAQWQAQQVQLAQLEELTKQRSPAREGAYSRENEQGQLNGGLVSADSAPTSRPPGMETVEVLTRLAALRDQGVLTEEEFASEKAKILSSGSPADQTTADTTSEHPPEPSEPQ